MQVSQIVQLTCGIGLVTLAACGGGSSKPNPTGPTPTPTPSPVASVVVAPSSASMTVDQALQLKVTVKDAAGAELTGRAVTWTTSNAAVAPVNSAGLVNGVAAGEATIMATTDGHTGSSSVTVTAPDPEGAGGFYTDPGAFQRAARNLDTRTVVTFNDINASPVNNSTVGRAPFDGGHYSGQGFAFASPRGDPLYIAPGGLPWNASNSLSVAQFPFEDASDDDADSLRVSLSQGCKAVSFELVDSNGGDFADEFVEFFDRTDASLRKAPLPQDYAVGRAFVGLVASKGTISKIVITENGNDGDDITYDDFACFN